MIAIRRLMIGGWGVEAGLRVRVIHPSQRREAPKQPLTIAERAMHEASIRRAAERRRAEAEIRWYTIGGV